MVMAVTTEDTATAHGVTAATEGTDTDHGDMAVAGDIAAGATAEAGDGASRQLELSSHSSHQCNDLNYLFSLLLLTYVVKGVKGKKYRSLLLFLWSQDWLQFHAEGYKLAVTNGVMSFANWQ